MRNNERETKQENGRQSKEADHRRPGLREAEEAEEADQRKKRNKKGAVRNKM